jgi:hypothetical protein
MFGWLLGEHQDGKRLQKTGALSREQLLEFFNRGHGLFDNEEVTTRAGPGSRAGGV